MNNVKGLALLFKNKPKARDLLNSPSGLQKLVLSAMLMLKVTKPEELRHIRDQIFTLIRMIRCWSEGNKAFISRKNILLVVAAIIYLVNPFDLVLDYLPLYGIVDDIAVLGFVVRSIQKDITRFIEWETENADNSNSAYQGAIH